MNKALRILENMDEPAAAAVRARIGDIDAAATPRRQAAYINRLLNAAGELCIDMTAPMRRCGGRCLSASAVKTAKKLRAQSSDTAEFLRLLNEADIGGGRLRLDAGRIIAVYTQCYCNIPKAEKEMNPAYCECSAGWYQRLFAEAFGRPVSVRILETIAGGAPQCTFEITDFE